MKLITKELTKKLPAMRTTERLEAADKVAVAKFFHPVGRGTWFAVEFDGVDEFFGFVVSPLGADCDEWGYFSLQELESVRVRGLGIERDRWFKPQTMREALPVHFG